MKAAMKTLLALWRHAGTRVMAANTNISAGKTKSLSVETLIVKAVRARELARRISSAETSAGRLAKEVVQSMAEL